MKLEMALVGQVTTTCLKITVSCYIIWLSTAVEKRFRSVFTGTMSWHFWQQFGSKLWYVWQWAPKISWQPCWEPRLKTTELHRPQCPFPCAVLRRSELSSWRCGSKARRLTIAEALTLRREYRPVSPSWSSLSASDIQRTCMAPALHDNTPQHTYGSTRFGENCQQNTGSVCCTQLPLLAILKQTSWRRQLLATAHASIRHVHGIARMSFWVRFTNEMTKNA